MLLLVVWDDFINSIFRVFLFFGYDFNGDPSGAAANHFDLLCSPLRNVDESSMVKWPPVRNAHNNASVVGQVGDTHVRTKRKPPMSTRGSMHVVHFTTRRLLTMKGVSIVRSNARIRLFS